RYPDERDGVPRALRPAVHDALRATRSPLPLSAAARAPEQALPPSDARGGEGSRRAAGRGDDLPRSRARFGREPLRLEGRAAATGARQGRPHAPPPRRGALDPAGGSP